MHARIEGLTGLRFLAALGILFHHFGGDLFGESADTFLLSLSSCVSFFFVLSGFILVYAYQATTTKVRSRRFFVARFARVYPTYLLGMVVLAYPLIKYGAAYSDWSPWENVPLFGSSILALQAWIPRYANILNPPSWSLSAEAFFYLCFPLFANRFRGALFQRPLVAIGILWLIGTLAALALEATVTGAREITDMGTQFASFNPLVRLPEFLMGMSLGAFHEKWKPSSSMAPTLLWISGGGALLATLAIGASGSIWQTAFHNSLLSPLFCMVILGLSRAEDPFGRFLASPPMVLLGEASYALYILHIPTMYAYSKLLRFGRIELPPTASMLLYFAVATLASVVAHLWFERPLRDLIRRKLTP